MQTYLFGTRVFNMNGAVRPYIQVRGGHRAPAPAERALQDRPAAARLGIRTGDHGEERRLQRRGRPGPGAEAQSRRVPGRLAVLHLLQRRRLRPEPRRAAAARLGDGVGGAARRHLVAERRAARRRRRGRTARRLGREAQLRLGGRRGARDQQRRADSPPSTCATWTGRRRTREAGGRTSRPASRTTPTSSRPTSGSHPFNGAAYYNSSRANGLGFWPSAGFALGGAFEWECCGETQPMSFNDMFSTTIGGIALGESQYRLSSEILNNQSQRHGPVLAGVRGLLRRPGPGVQPARQRRREEGDRQPGRSDGLAAGRNHLRRHGRALHRRRLLDHEQHQVLRRRSC